MAELLAYLCCAEKRKKYLLLYKLEMDLWWALPEVKYGSIIPIAISNGNDRLTRGKFDNCSMTQPTAYCSL